MLSHNESCFLYSYTIVSFGKRCENLQFVLLICVTGSKTCNETNVATEQLRRMLIELTANEEACAKVTIIEVFKYMVDKFGEKEI